MVATIADLFYKACEFDYPNALSHKKDGTYTPISHKELQARVERMVLAMQARGLRAGDAVALVSENRPEWAITDYACAIGGFPSVTIYPTLNAPQTGYILRNSESRWVVCSTPEQAKKVLEQWDNLPRLETLILMEGSLDPQGRNLITWDQVQAEGKAMEAHRPEVRQLARARKPTDLLTLIYTSGTTGDPKGAMLTHGNLISNILRCVEILPMLPGDSSLSFLPLSHIFERMAGHYTLFHIGATIAYAENMTTLAEDLRQVRPTILVSVPRIYEKIYANVRENVAASSIVKRFIFHWAMLAGRMAVPYLYEEKPIPPWIRFQLWWSRHLVFSKILARTGGRLRFAVSGGAPLAPMLMEFFWCIGLPIIEGYGLTETSPVLSFNRFGEVAPGKVGRPIYDEWKGRPFLKIAPDGEILAQGPCVMQGYWKNEKATAESFDPDGYFRTGDIGELDPQGRLKITDRKKELIITSGGKNLAPQPIEEALKTDKYITQAVLIGDQRNFVTALVVPNFSSLRRWAGYKKLHCNDDVDMVTKPEVYAKLMQRVERVNQQLSKFEQIKKISILDHEFTLESGQLTPSLKVKRRVINEMYAEQIEAMYR
ncbi:MAG: long-chain fatty acid--CoA ligase [Acidobacteria bacterium]|nr:long-chain fatty acid--CoA ligase [Acidobacteriota bacterium]